MREGDKMILDFEDGISIDISGPLRILSLHDGWYLVGEGLLMPADDLTHAEFLLREQTIFNELYDRKKKELEEV